MALKQHKDAQVRYDQQVENATNYVMPFIEHTHPLGQGTNVLEIGCGEGGVLLPFINRGCLCVGVDLNAERIDLCNAFLEDEVAAGKVEFMLKNVYDDDFLKRYKNYFDVVILKDVIEHVPEQEKFIPYLKNFLSTGGQIFFGFPPWYMPFGGHQQVLKNKLASMAPYYHILPKFIYRGILKLAKEDEAAITELMEIKDTQITIERFERIVKQSGMKVLHKEHFLINPIYKYKFKLQPRKQFGVISAIPFFRNFLTTCVYYTIGL